MTTEMILNGLKRLASNQNVSRQLATVAEQRLNAIKNSQDFLKNRSHKIAFIGHMGAGKSSMIGVLSGLYKGERPRDRSSLEANCILAIGAGGTTVCEVRIRATEPSERGKVGICIEPLSLQEMENEIRFFAQDEWETHNRRDTRPRGSDEDGDTTPREVQRFIRNMTGLSKRKIAYVENGQSKVRMDDPLDQLIKGFSSHEQLANHLIQLASLANRKELSWWWNDDEAGHSSMKSMFDNLNNGRVSTALLPKRIILVVPRPMPSSTSGMDLELIDTRGFDGSLETRDDLQELLRDPRVIPVVCTHFKEAPSESLRSLLKSIQKNPEIQASHSRLVIVLMDHGDANSVNGADRDREVGKVIKVDECRRELSVRGLEMFAGAEMHSFDVLQDETPDLIAVLDRQLNKVRDGVSAHLQQSLRDAEEFIQNAEVEQIKLKQQDVDRRIQSMLLSNFPEGAPMTDPLEGVYEGVASCRFASQVYASCRRAGDYHALNVYAAARSGAVDAIKNWLTNLVAIMQGQFKALLNDPELKEVHGHIRLRKDQFENAYLKLIHWYAEEIKSSTEKGLRKHGVWGKCSAEWGQGGGFKNRVSGHLGSCARRGDVALPSQPASQKLLPPGTELAEKVGPTPSLAR